MRMKSGFLPETCLATFSEVSDFIRILSLSTRLVEGGLPFVSTLYDPGE